MPVYAALAGRSIMHNGAHAADVAEPRSQTRPTPRTPYPWEKPQSWRSSRSWPATTANAQTYPRGSGESVTWSWQQPASQAARVSWMSRRVWLSAVI